MKYIKFNKTKLPFKPVTSQVIYFDVSDISMKMGHPMARVVDTYYDFLCSRFQQAGLEFCFLPRVSSSLNVPELYHYFNPNASDIEIAEFQRYNRGRLSMYELQYILRDCIVDESYYNFGPGLIRYMGEEFDRDDYFFFSYVTFQHKLFRQLRDQTIDYNQQLLSSWMEQINCYLIYNREDDSIITTDSQDGLENETDLLSEAQKLVARFQRNGIDQMVIDRMFHPTKTLSRIEIKQYRIFLVDYNNIEITMPTLSKALFFFYLRHPEGVEFKRLVDYKAELSHIYASFAGVDDRERIERSIDDLVDPTKNSLNEKASRIRRAFLSNINDELAKNYYIVGNRSETRKILLPRELVIWNI